MNTTSYLDVSRKIIQEVAHVSPGENVLILTYSPVSKLIPSFLAAVVHEIGGVPSELTIPTLEYPGAPLPPPAEAIFKEVNVIILATSKSSFHGKAIKEAANNSRIISIPGAKEEMFTGGASTMNQGALRVITEKVAEIIGGGKEFQLKSEAGTNATFKGRKEVIAGYGQCPTLGGGPNGLGMFPDGEAAIAIYEDSLEGRIVVDTYQVGIGALDNPIVFEVNKGKAEISGGSEAYRLRKLIEEHGDENTYFFGEFAVGTNPKARFIGSNGEDKKVMGTVHLSLGDDTPLGDNKSRLHLDGVINKPTLYVDSKIIIKSGKLIGIDI